MAFTRGGREGESAVGASQQSPEPGAGGGEELAERHRADSEDVGGAEDPLPRPPLQEFQHPDDHRQRDAGRPEESKSTLTRVSLRCSAILWLPKLIAAVQGNVAMLFNLSSDKIKEKVPLSLMTGLDCWTSCFPPGGGPVRRGRRRRSQPDVSNQRL